MSICIPYYEPYEHMHTILTQSKHPHARKLLARLYAYETMRMQQVLDTEGLKPDSQLCLPLCSAPHI